MSELIESPQFADMPIGKLREYASHLRVAIPKTATKVEIIQILENKVRQRAVPELASHATGVRPGYAKIRINEDPSPGASNLPVYINANGYQCTIPRGVDVIVPMRVVRTLNDAITRKKKQSITRNADGRESFTETEMNVLSYPFQVLEMTPGPEVLTPLEAQKKRIMGPRIRYWQMFGRWPRPADLQRALEKGLIKLNEEEELGVGVEALIDNK